jgi:anti-sigma factor RsiW
VICREAIGFLTDYLAGDLPTDVRQAFEIHLDRCPNCRVFLLQLQETIRAGQLAVTASEEADRQGEIPEGLVRAIMSTVRGTP